MPDQDDIATAIGTGPAVDVTNDASGKESSHGSSVDDESQPQSTGDSLVAQDPAVVDPMDVGWNPPEKWSVAQGYGNTPLEESLGESMDQRLRQEEPDPYRSAELEAKRGELDALVVEDPVPSDGSDAQVGDARAGRLVDPDEGARTDAEKDLVGIDVGIDGAAATAEEAAVHVIAAPTE